MNFKILLFPLSMVYLLLYRLNSMLYKVGLRKSYTFKVPVVSIGNITVGGTGKTPITKTIAKYFLDQGLRPGIVSRGYKRQSKAMVRVCDGKTTLADITQCGDEPYLLSKALQMRVPIVVSNNKVNAINAIQDDYGVDLVILDDGFQSFSIKRDVDIVLINKNESYGSYWLLPTGRMREPLSALSRSDFIVLTKTGKIQRVVEDAMKSSKLNVLDSSTSTFIVKEASNGELERVSLSKGLSIMAFCGIADEKSFFQSLLDLNLNIKKDITFSDHHRYSKNDIISIKKEMTGHAVDCIVTTEKDYYKLPKSFIEQCNVHVIKYEINLDDKDLESIKLSVGL